MADKLQVNFIRDTVELTGHFGLRINHRWVIESRIACVQNLSYHNGDVTGLTHMVGRFRIGSLSAA